ncbi:hypothetical protein Cs7R123_66400 [Catellatospora sp. TT07R-123]|uniref:hypothetical protein n=1 Tax=Catellatospora sp. TT07R-123 TaxID=2733863 RepID=UPI001AFD281B|nr:hypothetical protein [Catellatospora sp. TT07R-123]GHJ49298.1 hypothetical protein Cs7R123_66400 [Catellatospora sp. TT07R-123]
MAAPVPQPSAEPPALAALLVQPPRRLAAAGAYATMLDLVARGVLVHDQAAGTIRAPSPRPVGLAAFEQQVVDAVTDRTGGSEPTPLGAIDLGSQKQAEQWHERFAGFVGAAGQARGLARPRVSAGARTLLWTVFTFTWIGAAVAMWLTGYGPYIFLVVLGAGVAAVPLRTMGRLVPHGRGVGLAAVYARLRRERIDPADPRLPYAVAAGAKVPGLAASPFAEGAGDFAWSRRDGTWRRIPVVHPRGLSAGLAPKGALFALPGGLVFFGAWLIVLSMLSADLTLPELALLWPPLALAAGWLLWALGVFVIGRIAYRGAYDLTHPVRIVTGPVVRLEEGSGDEAGPPAVAVDEGAGAAVRYEVGAELHGRLRKDMWLRLEVTPRLGHVRRAEIFEG